MIHCVVVFPGYLHTVLVFASLLIFSAYGAPVAQPADSQSTFSAYRNTIADLVTTAMSRNPQLASQSANIRAANTDQSQQRGLPPPLVSVEYMQSTTMADMREIEYGAEQMIMFPGRQRSMRTAESFRPRMAVNDSTALARKITADVIFAVNEVYLQDRLADVNSESMAVLRSLISALRSKYETGSSGQQPMLRAEAALFSAQSDSADLTGMRGAAEAMAGALLGDTIRRNVPLLPDFILPPINPGTVETVVAKALDNRSEIESMETKIRMDSMMIKAASASYAPDFTVRASYRDAINEPEDVVGVMVGMTLPVAPWSMGRTTGGVARARAELDRSRADLLNMKSMVRAEITAAHSRLVAALLCCTRYETASIDKADAALQASLSEYRTGMGDLSMVLDDLKMKLMAQEAYFMAKMELLNAVAELDRATGTPFDSSLFFGGRQ